MKVYAYNPETECGYVYRFEEDGTIYERALQPFGGWDRETVLDVEGITQEGIVLGLVEDGFVVGIDRAVVLEHCKWELTDDARVSHIGISICKLDEYLEPYDTIYEIRTTGAEAIGIDVPKKFFSASEDSDFPIEFVRSSIVGAYRRKDLRWILAMNDTQALAGKHVERIITRGLQDGQLLRLSVSTEEAVAYLGLVGVAVSVHLFFTHNR